MNDIDIDSIVGDIVTALHYIAAKTITLRDALQDGGDAAVAYNARLLAHCVRDAVQLILAIGDNLTTDSQHPRNELTTPS